MFAAFSSDSDYGRLPSWRWLSFSADEEDEQESSEEELPSLQEAADFIRRSNAKPYTGMLDEDFVPHVEAFWYGLKHLCTFIDAHICVNGDVSRFCISDESRNKLMRAVTSNRLVLDETCLDIAAALEERLQRELDSHPQIKPMSFNS